MLLPSKKILLFVFFAGFTGVVLSLRFFNQSAVDFNTQVKPIFNKKCITCHGGVKRESGFSLLFRKDALDKVESGKPAIIPGDADHSEMMKRVTSEDPAYRMPYKHNPLSKEEISILRNWINEGAVWGNHWAYVKVAPPKMKSAKAGLAGGEWGTRAMDSYILGRLDEMKLAPSAEAEKSILLRRVSLDLTGLPAPQTLADQFVKSNDPKAYEMLVDSLLASPHYGERWASLWMDIARYADTKGYEKDEARQIWRYRDWVIHAFNADMPYNQFLTEQLAGDLLPSPTDAQYIATAFHRNTMTNDEGGTDDEEFRTAAVLDRVNTTWDGLMGTTFGCVQCHSHPYDPFRHEEYYKFLAFFNNSRDEDTPDDYPLLRHFTREDESTLQSVKTWIEKNGTPEKAKEAETFIKTWQPAVNALQGDQLVRSNLSNADLLFHINAQCRLKQIDLGGKNELIFRHQNHVKGGVLTIHLDKQDGPVLNTIHLNKKTDNWVIGSVDLSRQEGVHDLFFRYSNASIRNPDTDCFLLDWVCFTSSLPGKDRAGYAKVHDEYWTLLTKNIAETTPIMIENHPDMQRSTHVFERGNWRAKGKEVKTDVPSSLNPFPSGAPRNRLGLAQWMTSEDNPLVSRAMANRLWEQLFGNGLAETLEDLGTQGLPPTHRELLDYLAWNFMHDWKWSIKTLLKEIVMSSTYRQSSKVTEEMLAKDAANRFYARAPRIRLSAEQVRDQGLAISGLLSEKMYGPSVMPYQPEGIWLSPYNGSHWKKSSGEDQYRRALYTFWKRTAPYPAMTSFDGVAREVCVSRRIRTNTPLQALVTLNDSAFVEISRHFAYRMKEGTATAEEQLKKGFHLALGYDISKEKLIVLKNFYNRELTSMKEDHDKVSKISADPNGDAETAALIVVANVILNLDEVIRVC